MERFWVWLAWRLPRRLTYWASIRLLSAATCGKWENESPSGLLAKDALNRWEHR
jgi:hypothetical protein